MPKTFFRRLFSDQDILFNINKKARIFWQKRPYLSFLEQKKAFKMSKSGKSGEKS